MVPIGHVLAISALLLLIGLTGVVLRRNIFLMLMSIELMLNAANIAFVGFARERASLEGQAFAFLVIALAAAEAAIGLAIVVAVFRTRQTTDIEDVNLMKH